MLKMYLVEYGCNSSYMTFMAECAKHAAEQFADTGEEGEINAVYLCQEEPW